MSGGFSWGSRGGLGGVEFEWGKVRWGGGAYHRLRLRGADQRRCGLEFVTSLSEKECCGGGNTGRHESEYSLRVLRYMMSP